MYWLHIRPLLSHYSDVMMSAMASQIFGVSIAYSTVCSGVDQRKYQSSVPLAFLKRILRWPVNSPHKGASNAENASIWLCHHVREFSIPMEGFKYNHHQNLYLYNQNPLYWHGLTLSPAWITNHMSSKVWVEITYPFSNCTGAAVEVCEWMNNIIPYVIIDVITYPCLA